MPDDYPERDRRHDSSEAVGWRLGDLEHRVNKLHNRIHTLESSDAANRHLLGMIEKTDKRVDEIELHAAEQRGALAEQRRAITTAARGFNRRDKIFAATIAFVLLCLQILQYIHPIHQ